MKPENVNPKNFKVENIVYDNEYFFIAYGIWEEGNRHLVMRWNGESDDPGYPKLFNPLHGASLFDLCLHPQRTS